MYFKSRVVHMPFKVQIDVFVFFGQKVVFYGMLYTMSWTLNTAGVWISGLYALLSGLLTAVFLCDILEWHVTAQRACFTFAWLLHVPPFVLYLFFVLLSLYSSLWVSWYLFRCGKCLPREPPSSGRSPSPCRQHERCCRTCCKWPTSCWVESKIRNILTNGLIKKLLQWGKAHEVGITSKLGFGMTSFEDK